MGGLGELAALAVSICWAISSTMFERSGKLVGSLSVNYIRLFMAFIMLGLYGLIRNGQFFPVNAGAQQWLWLSVSGFFGFFLGDLFLFQAMVLIGSRLSMLVMTFTPAITALIGYVALSENLNFYQILAIFLIIVGILMAFVGFDKGQFRFKLSLKGFLFAVGGAMGQSLGLIFGKKGIVDYDPFAATQIRIITGFLAFTLLIMVLNHWPSIIRAVSDRKAMKAMVLGSFFGPFLGVALSMFAIIRTQTGIASALMALTPMVLLIPALLKGRRIANREWIGALISVGGVALLFI